MWSLTSNLRTLEELSVPDRNIEPAVATTPGIPDISLHKEPELSGGFAELAKKVIKIKDYKENIPKKRK